MKIRALIVDDEPLARQRLRQLLEGAPEVEVIGECADGAAAVTAILEHRPSLVFLDVQMPEMNGFEVVRHIAQSPPVPAIIFVTAYDQYALKAFEVHALDYLLKPFDRDRFQVALDRACDHLQREGGPRLEERLSALLSGLQPAQRVSDRIAVKTANRILLLRIGDIDWIEAADNYVKLHVGKDAHLHRETLSNLEERLDPAKFIRISRSTMVNVERIKELQPMFHGEYVVILKDGAQLSLSRSHRDKLQVLFGKLG